MKIIVTITITIIIIIIITMLPLFVGGLFHDFPGPSQLIKLNFLNAWTFFKKKSSSTKHKLY